MKNVRLSSGKHHSQPVVLMHASFRTPIHTMHSSVANHISTHCLPKNLSILWLHLLAAKIEGKLQKVHQLSTWVLHTSLRACISEPAAQSFTPSTAVPETCSDLSLFLNTYTRCTLCQARLPSRNVWPSISLHCSTEYSLSTTTAPSVPVQKHHQE